MQDAAAGRMNARGISVFYGAKDTATAIAEVRPPVGSTVAVAQFEIIRPLRLLDLTALRDTYDQGSLFDQTFVKRLEKAAFLRSLTGIIARPVMPNDEEFDHLATQAIADFLANENAPPLNGIVFPSFQAAPDALNVVLFHGAAKVDAIELPEGTTVEAHTGWDTEDGWEEDYTVIELSSPQRQEDGTSSRLTPREFSSAPGLSLYGLARDPRPATLRIDLGSIKIHAVQRVQFDCREHPVRRHRIPIPGPAGVEEDIPF